MEFCAIIYLTEPSDMRVTQSIQGLGNTTLLFVNEDIEGVGTRFCYRHQIDPDTQTSRLPLPLFSEISEEVLPAIGKSDLLFGVKIAPFRKNLCERPQSVDKKGDSNWGKKMAQKRWEKANRLPETNAILAPK